MAAPTCPTPAKVGYKNRKAANRQMWVLWKYTKDATRVRLHPYLCPCGNWHIGHARARAK